jgi:purine-binding chemotaxis protein CheW
MPHCENKTLAEQHVSIVTFRLGRQTYALPIAPVRQIIEMVTITPLPQVNHTVAGVIDFHGKWVPVINLRCQLSLAEAPLQLHTPILLVNISGRLVGLIVDQVLDVLERPANQIIDPSNILLEEMGEIPLLQGLIQSQDGSILLLNLEQLFKPYHTRGLLEAVDTLNQSLEQNGSSGVDVNQSLETPPALQNTEVAVKNKAERQPGKLSKKRSRKIADPTPEATHEATA